MRRFGPWVAVCGLTMVLMLLSTAESLHRYWDFQSGWPWDLAYNNQWFWALVEGDGRLSIRPINSWGDEGPSIWVRTHLDPLRMIAAPFYLLYARPETLIVIHNVVIWLVLPAAFGLLRSETESLAVALSGVALVPLTPLLEPLLWNDFREMELAIPFVIWAIQGFRQRHRGLAALGVIGMLAAREEFGVMVATFAFISPKYPEDIGKSYAWARTAMLVGVGWVVFAFFGFQYLMVSSNAPEKYLAHFGGPKPGLIATAKTALDFVVIGLGSWSLLAVFAPREALLAVPWLWGVSNGRWSLSRLSDWHWHHVRYMTPIVALVLAAGLIGYARLATWLLQRRRGGWWLAGLWLTAMLGLLAARRDVQARMDQIPWPISHQEAQNIWSWIDQVGPDDGVVACYEVSAPLSSRKEIYSNRLVINLPKDYPRINSKIHWTFLRNSDYVPNDLKGPDFEKVYQGPFLQIHRRVRTP